MQSTRWRSTIVLALAAVAILAIVLPLAAQEKMEGGGGGMAGMAGMPMSEMPKGDRVMLKGYVRDAGCFVMRNLSGKSHEDCAAQCNKNGVPVGFEADNGKFYILIKPGHPADSANPMTLQYREKRVEIRGIANTVKGQNVLAVMSIQSAA